MSSAPTHRGHTHDGCPILAFEDSVLWDAAGNLDGTPGNGRVSFGQPPRAVREWANRVCPGRAAIAVRPVIVSASLSAETSAAFEVAAADFTGPPVEQGSAIRRRMRFFRTAPGSTILDLYLSNLWVPVVRANGTPYDLRFVTDVKTGSILFTWDYQWMPWGGGSDVLVEAVSP